MARSRIRISFSSAVEPNSPNGLFPAASCTLTSLLVIAASVFPSGEIWKSCVEPPLPTICRRRSLGAVRSHSSKDRLYCLPGVSNVRPSVMRVRPSGLKDGAVQSWSLLRCHLRRSRPVATSQNRSRQLGSGSVVARVGAVGRDRDPIEQVAGER